MSEKSMKDARYLVGTISIIKVCVATLLVAAMFIALIFGIVGVGGGGAYGIAFALAVNAFVIWAVLGWLEYSLEMLIQIAHNTRPVPVEPVP